MAFFPNDPRFINQWHLNNTDPDEYDLNVVDVWDDYDGSGVRVAVLDRGFDFTHPDFDNYRTDLDWDFEDNDANAFPNPDSNPFDDSYVGAHGTPVAGIIGASQDGEGTVGVAFGATLVGYKTDWSRDEVEAAIEAATAANHDVISMSYGEGAGVFRDRDSLVDAAETAGETGRDGLGLIMVKSAGNSRKDANQVLREETTGEALENLRHTIVVAGVSDEGMLPPVDSQLTNDSEDKSSSPGANLLTTAFYGREGSSVQTTDIVGNAGYVQGNPGAYTGFTGTSAAAPQVAGVVALMLEANPNLGWRDVQDIIAYSSRHIGSDVGSAATGEEQATQSNGATWFFNGADNWNGGGLHFSNDYGFGLIDAKAAVRLAETWQNQSTSANEATPARVDGLDSEVTIAEGSTSGGSNFYSLTFASGINVENITLGVNFVSVADLADLEIYLTSPSGTRVQLIADTGDSENYSGYWRFGSTAFKGEDSQGTWRVQIRDDDNAVISPIVINDIDLWTYGANSSQNDTFIFTNEFSDYAAGASHSTNIVGGPGSDTINTSAVDAASIINLQLGSGIIDGVAVTMSSIRDIYAGDGGDILFDGAGGNDIHGGRGNDIIRDTDAGGVDRYYGQQGNDWMQVYSAIGSDAFFGGSGTDHIWWTNSGETSATFDLVNGEARDANGNVEVMVGFENLTGTAYGDTIIENARVNVLDGHDGDDTFIINSGVGADTYRGGAGRDTIDWSAVGQDGIVFDLAAGTATRGSASEAMEDFENIIGTNQDDVIIENGAPNIINALGGDDRVIVTTVIGADSFAGGFGNDTIDWSGSSQIGGTYDLVTGQATAGIGTEAMTGFENLIGTNNRDTIIEGNGPNVIDARGGDDTVRVTTVIGVDSFRGGFGNDTIDWSGSSQTGGTYNFVTGRALANGDQEVMEGFENFVGTSNADTVIEGNGANVIETGSGNDTVQVTTTIGVDAFRGGFGVDTIDWSTSQQSAGTYNFQTGRASYGASEEVMEGFENFIGTNFGDTVIEGNGANNINTRGGDDTVMVTTVIGVDSFAGGFGNDTIDWSGSGQINGIYDLSGGTASYLGNTETMVGFENFVGTNQRDIVLEGNGINAIELGDGNDILRVTTRVETDSYDGGDGIDLIDWSALDGVDSPNGTLYDLGGGFARDANGAIEGMINFENLYGTDFDDLIQGNSGANLLRGLEGRDNIGGRGGDDLISGGDGQDRLRGNGGDDFLAGDAGNDRMFGGAGNDTLVDGDGTDRFYGQAGADTFRFVEDTLTDRIMDFELGLDVIELSGVTFGDLSILNNTAGHVRIDYGSERIILRDLDDMLDASDLSAANFVFV